MRIKKNEKQIIVITHVAEKLRATTRLPCELGDNPVLCLIILKMQFRFFFFPILRIVDYAKLKKFNQQFKPHVNRPCTFFGRFTSLL